MWSPIWAISGALLASGARAQNTIYPTFINPPNLTTSTAAVIASTYTVGDELTLQFTTPWSSITVGVWLQYPQFDFLNLSKLPGAIGLAAGTTQFQWKIDFSGTDGGPNISLSDQSRFNFALFREGTQEHIDSQHISIRSVATSTSSSSTSPSPTITSTSNGPSGGTTSAATSSSTPAATVAAVSNGQSSSSLSTGAKAGIGVGVGLGVLALASAVVAAILYKKRRQRPIARPESELDGTAYRPVDTQEPKPPNVYSEMPSERPISELPGEMGYSYAHR